MLSLSTPSGIDTDNIISINKALPSDILAQSHDISISPLKSHIPSQNHLSKVSFNPTTHMASIVNQSDIKSQSHLSAHLSKNQTSNISMSNCENFIPYSNSELMYPMYQSSTVPRRHSTVDSYDNIEVNFQNFNDSKLSLELDNKATSMTHFENSSFYQNYFTSSNSKGSSLYNNNNNSNIDSFQPFHSIKANSQLPFYSESNALLSLPKKISLYKTELCRTFEETGYCRYGIKCQFAHDKSELRIIPRHPRYKTEICRTFWELGNCPYGKRCCFIHLEAGTLMNGKPPGQAKLTTDNQFNGPVYHGFQKDQLVKSNISELSTSDGINSSLQDHSIAFDSNCNGINNLSLTDSNNLITFSPPSNTLSPGDSNFSLSPGFDWMRTRRSQSLSLPSPATGNWGFKSIPIANAASSTAPISPKGFDIYSYDSNIPIIENNDYICQNCSKDPNAQNSNDPFSASQFSSSYHITNSFKYDNSGYSCNVNIEDESSESIMADSLLASLPDY